MIIGLILPVFAVGSIVRPSINRECNPWLWGTVSAGGYVVLSILFGIALNVLGELLGVADSMARAEVPLLVEDVWVGWLAGWCWLGAVALYIRYRVGRVPITTEPRAVRLKRHGESSS